MKRAYAALTAALLALLLVVPVGAQSLGPQIAFGDVGEEVIAGANCDPLCLELTYDGNYETGCPCWSAVWCGEPAYYADYAVVRVLTGWDQGFVVNVKTEGVAGPHPRVVEAGLTRQVQWHTFTNFGNANCVVFAGLGGWGDPFIYEVEAYFPPESGTGRVSPIQGDFWMVRTRIGDILGTEIVSNFIYVILALILGAMGLTMVIRGLFGQTGVGDFHHGSGMAQRGSGLAHKGSGLSQREVGDVD